MVTKIRRADGTPAEPPTVVHERIPVREVDVKALVHGYVAQAKSIRTLVTESGVSYGTVHARLRAAGVTMRPRGGAWRAEQASAAQPTKRAAKRAARAK